MIEANEQKRENGVLSVAYLVTRFSQVQEKKFIVTQSNTHNLDLLSHSTTLVHWNAENILSKKIRFQTNCVFCISPLHWVHIFNFIQLLNIFTEFLHFKCILLSLLPVVLMFESSNFTCLLSSLDKKFEIFSNWFFFTFDYVKSILTSFFTKNIFFEFLAKTNLRDFFWAKKNVN